MAVASYAEVSDVADYLPPIDSTANQDILTTLIDAASRFIDNRCGRYFYDDGLQTKYFDGDGSMLAILDQDFFAAPDASVVLTQAYYENQPLSGWLTAIGDGITPPSNFYLLADGADNPAPYIAVDGSSVYRPWNWVQLVMTPAPGGPYLPMFSTGQRTVGITAHWGWPAIPSTIVNLTCKLAARAWIARQGGWQIQRADVQSGVVVNMSKYYDQLDAIELSRGGYIRQAP